MLEISFSIQRMSFRKIIQFIQSAWRELRLRFLCIAQQQPKKAIDDLQTTVEELQETIVLLQKRIEANAAANEKLEALGKKFTAELEKLDAKRIGDNKRIEDGLEELKKMIKDLQKRTKNKPGDHRGNRGGEDREDGPNQHDESDNPAAELQPPQCRFVCYEDNRGWAVALAVEAGQNAQSVKQGDNKLSANGDRYILEDISAKVTVEFKDENSLQSFQLLEKHKFMVFKMRKDWKGEGQKVKSLSSGDYVVFAPKSCGKRINKEPPIEPEQCRYPDFTVHFFSVSENSEMNDGFENCSLPFSSTKRFSLKGQSFLDDSDLGELFGDDAPQLVDDKEWRGISWIVVGRENGGKVLAKFLLPELLPKEKEKMLAKVLGERSGWFFVRIYDANVELLHSFPFRRAKGLKNISSTISRLGKWIRLCRRQTTIRKPLSNLKETCPCVRRMIPMEFVK